MAGYYSNVGHGTSYYPIVLLLIIEWLISNAFKLIKASTTKCLKISSNILGLKPYLMKMTIDDLIVWLASVEHIFNVYVLRWY